MQTETPVQGQLLRIGDLARLTGKTARAIHLYEELGLVRPATRSSGGFRLYDPSAVERLQWVDSLHALGFSLLEMRDVLQNWWTADLGPSAMANLRELFTRKLAETRESLERHRRLERELEEGLRYLETCESCASPGSVHVCVNCQQDHGVSSAPALVAGIKTPPEGVRRASRPPFVRVEEVVQAQTRETAPAAAGIEARKEPTR